MMQTLTGFLHHHRKAIAITAAAGGVVALLLSLSQPLRYRATMRLLIIPATSPAIDAFTAVKSAEKVGRNLGRVIVSSSFLDRVLAAHPAVDPTVFPSDERRRRKRWERTVESSVPSETSVMEIRVYHERTGQARAIADAIGIVLARDVHQYTGSRDIGVTVIDPPLVSRYPVRPNIPLDTALGLVLGALLGAAWSYIRKPLS